VAGSACALAPDLDVVGFRFGIRYGDVLGHRGFSHSLVFAGLLAAFGAACWPAQAMGKWWVFGVLFACGASHGVLDAFTNGGLGVAFLSPFSNERFFAPIQPLEVSPLGPRQILSERGWNVLRSEVVWLWFPVVVARALVVFCRRFRRASHTHSRGGFP
jgi:inner membrane protein